MNPSPNDHSSTQNAGQQAAQQAKTQARPWVVGLARLGYAARGVVYAVIGVLAFQAALGAGGQTTDSQGALFKIAQQPFGRVMLGVVGLGLLGYALWRFVQTALDPEGKGTDAKGIAQRFGYALSGLIYASLALTAFRIVVGSNSGGGSTQQDWTVRLLSTTGGQLLLGAVGVAIIGAGLYSFYQAVSAKFREKLKTQEMSHTEDVWITRLGRAGFAARGVVWSIIGWFFVRAATQVDAKEAGGLAQALDTLASQPQGLWMLGLVACGLIAYGAYALAEARYRKIYL